jgi:hypothetical protein
MGAKLRSERLRQAKGNKEGEKEGEKVEEQSLTDP